MIFTFLLGISIRTLLIEYYKFISLLINIDILQSYFLLEFSGYAILIYFLTDNFFDGKVLSAEISDSIDKSRHFCQIKPIDSGKGTETGKIYSIST